jgi:hypothetical protein
MGKGGAEKRQLVQDPIGEPLPLRSIFSGFGFRFPRSGDYCMTSAMRSSALWIFLILKPSSLDFKFLVPLEFLYAFKQDPTVHILQGSSAAAAELQLTCRSSLACQEVVSLCQAF